jgi:hypothetical protein
VAQSDPEQTFCRSEHNGEENGVWNRSLNQGDAMKKLQRTLPLQAALSVLCLLCVGNGQAEVRTITATGEYRMGDNDTRTDAKRLALLDAKRPPLNKRGPTSRASPK